MQRKLELDISPPEVIELLKENAPKNDLEGLKQSTIQIFKIPEFTLSKWDKRIRFTGEREFVVEYVYSIYALTGQVDAVSGTTTIYLWPKNTTAIKIMKWGPIVLLTYTLTVLFLIPGIILDEPISFWVFVVIITALSIWAVTMCGFYYLIKVLGGRRAEKDLYDHIYSILKPHLIRGVDFGEDR